jgi:hypothetical protein
MGSENCSARSAVLAGIPLMLGMLGIPGVGACNGDPVYVLGRLPGSGGFGGGNDSGFPAGGSAGAGGLPPDDGAVDDAGCAPPLPVRDYAFTGVGTEVSDRRGGPPGVIHGGAVLDDSGELTLDGEDDYVDLPNGILSGLNQVTVVAWIRQLAGSLYPGPAYTRIFDFGVGSDGEDPAEGEGTVGRIYLAATPQTGFEPIYLAALISGEGSGGEIAAPTDRRLDDQLLMVAVSASLRTLELFLDGDLIGRVPSDVPVSSIENVNNWLGRSQYDNDPYLHASYAGVQVFDSALAECAIRTLYAKGPGAP